VRESRRAKCVGGWVGGCAFAGAACPEAQQRKRQVTECWRHRNQGMKALHQRGLIVEHPQRLRKKAKGKEAKFSATPTMHLDVRGWTSALVRDAQEGGLGRV
jgi:hypothetical protein